VDLSADALEVARLNGRRLNITADFRQSDLFTDIGGRYEMIVSNPPYIPTGVIPTLEEEVRSYDPNLALDGGEDGLSFYRRIVEQASTRLEDGGWLLFEIGHDQGRCVRDMMENAGYGELQVVKDLAGRDRVVLGRRMYRRNRDV
ncbi:MAG: HemK/PrmC family methyltransferase, partial [Sellimonas intestinalis]